MPTTHSKYGKSIGKTQQWLVGGNISFQPQQARNLHNKLTADTFTSSASVVESEAVRLT